MFVWNMKGCQTRRQVFVFVPFCRFTGLNPQLRIYMNASLRAKSVRVDATAQVCTNPTV